MAHFTTLTILFVFVGLFMVVLYFANKRLDSQKKTKQVQSIKLNLVLKSLLLNMQKQRGLCSLNSNTNLILVQDVEACIEDNDKLIKSAEYKYSYFLNSDPHWRSIRGDWVLLKNNIFIFDTETNFITHNVLIENIVFMMENIAHKGQLDIGRILSEDEIKAIWCNIPQTLEALGRTRVIGSGVAAEGVCSRENKVKLINLSDEIVRNYKYISTHLTHLPTGEMYDMPSQIAQSIDSFLIIVHDELITPEVPRVTPDVFFNQATQTMDGVSQLFETISVIKERQITNAVV